MEILERFWDLADRYRVIVKNDDERTQMFKFREETPDEEVLVIADKFFKATADELTFTEPVSGNEYFG